jgi:hypothetical protein
VADNRRHRTLKWIAAIGAVLLLALVVAAWGIGYVAAPQETGYFAPVFAPDGESVFAITREVRATVAGFGAQGFTPPATVHLSRDRFRLVQVHLPDGRVTTIEAFPPSPLEGATIAAYHGAIFGVPQAHLRWADPGHLEYEMAVTRHDSPSSRTFVVQRLWNPSTRAFVTAPPWQEGPTRMAGGDEPQQLHGDREVMAVPGGEMMPCAVALLGRDGSATTIVDTGACRRKYASGISREILQPISRRAEIERIQTITSTYAGLVARGRAAGRSEGQAMLDAGREMERVGLYPKRTALVAARGGCEGASPVFTISDMEFTVGLFPDIEQAIASPGTEVDKSMGDYVTHRDYSTSREINDYLNSGHTSFVVRARGACWRLTVQRP